MFANLVRIAAARLETRRKRAIARLAEHVPPPGVSVTADANGITLAGRRLRRRIVADVRMREFYR